jgi:hypothetical protein
MHFMSRCSIPAVILWIVTLKTISALRRLKLYLPCDVLVITSVYWDDNVSHGQGALETGLVCYGVAQKGTARKAWMYSKQRMADWCLTEHFHGAFHIGVSQNMHC